MPRFALASAVPAISIVLGHLRGTTNRPRAVFRWAAAAALAAGLTLGAPTPAAAQNAAAEGRKSPALALGLSVVVPGAGQVYNGHYAKGAVMFVGAVAAAGSIVLTLSDLLGLDDDESGTGVHVLGAAGMGLILWSWIDAPLSAKAINRRLDAGRLALEIGPRVENELSGWGVGLSLARIEF